EPLHDARTGIGDEPDAAAFARLEAHGRSRWNVETETACLRAVELKRWVRFVEMIVAADLDRAVAAVNDDKLERGAAGVQLGRTGCAQEFSGDHEITAPDRGRSRAWCRRGRWPRPGPPGSSRPRPP